jgi:hypothetical protein
MPLQTHIRSPLLTAAPISRLRRARAQEGGTILFFGFFKPGQISVRSPGSAGADQAPEGWKGKSFCFQAAIVSAPSKTTPAVTYFQKAISSFRAKATIVLSELGHH